MVRDATMRSAAMIVLLALGSSVAAAGIRVPNLVSSYENGLAAQCREVGGTPAEPSPGFLIRGDLNRDGIGDWALDEGKFNCTGAASLYGGSGGSQVVVFLGLPGGGAKQAFQHGAFGMRLERVGTAETLWLEVGGSLCGQSAPASLADATFCYRPLVWDQEHERFAFAPLSRARFPGHSRSRR